MKNTIYSLITTSFLIFVTLSIAILGLPCLFLPRKFTAKLIHNWSKFMLFLFKNLNRP